MTTGLAIGKFWPPHLGHHHLIQTLSSRCSRVVVIVCASSTQLPTGRDRALWLQTVHPGAEIVVVDDFCAWHHPDACPEDCSRAWANRVLELRLGSIDEVATSEPYGVRFSECLGASHFEVDAPRLTYPVSSSQIRVDLSHHWIFLHRVVRAGLTRKVVVLGAESTGTTTLASDLSSRFGSPCVAEAGRLVSWDLFARNGNDMDRVKWTENDFWQIVDHQMWMEQRAVDAIIDEMPGELGPWIVGDTDTLATVAWWERYLGTPADSLRRFAESRTADLYLLTDPDGVDFDDSDPLRDGRSVRQGMHGRFIELLEGAGRPWQLVSGDREERVATALHAIQTHEKVHPRWRHH